MTPSITVASWLFVLSICSVQGDSSTCHDETSLLQVKQDLKSTSHQQLEQRQIPLLPEGGSQSQRKSQPRVSPPEAVLEMPASQETTEPASLDQAPENVALYSAGYPVVTGYPISAPLGAGFPAGGYAPMRQSAARAAQAGANRMVAETAKTVAQAAHVAENAAVAAAAYPHQYAAPYLPGYGGTYGDGFYPRAAAPFMQEPLPVQMAVPAMAGYSADSYPALYPTIAQPAYSAYPSYPYQRGFYAPTSSSQIYSSLA